MTMGSHQRTKTSFEQTPNWCPVCGLIRGPALICNKLDCPDAKDGAEPTSADGLEAFLPVKIKVPSSSSNGGLVVLPGGHELLLSKTDAAALRTGSLPTREEIARNALRLVVAHIDAIAAEERNDFDNRKAARTLADRFRFDSANNEDGWAGRKIIAALSQGGRQ